MVLSVSSDRLETIRDDLYCDFVFHPDALFPCGGPGLVPVQSVSHWLETISYLFHLDPQNAQYSSHTTENKSIRFISVDNPQLPSFQYIIH